MRAAGISQAEYDEGDMTRVTVAGSALDATSWHPVWVEERGDFAKIGSLTAGEHLRSADESLQVVTDVQQYEQVQPVYDLTIDGVHTYHVLAGTSPVLVHNCGDGPTHLVGKGDDPLVPELVDEINARYPGHVRAQGIDINGPDGKTLTDFDIVTRNAVVQVKTGGGKGALSQALTTQGLTDLPVIVYIPQGKGTMFKSLESAGIMVTRDKDVLLDVLAP